MDALNFPSLSSVHNFLLQDGFISSRSAKIVAIALIIIGVLAIIFCSCNYSKPSLSSDPEFHSDPSDLSKKVWVTVQPQDASIQSHKVPVDMTVMEFKHKVLSAYLASKQRVDSIFSIDQLALSFKGKELDDSKTLVHNGLVQGSNIHLSTYTQEEIGHGFNYKGIPARTTGSL